LLKVTVFDPQFLRLISTMHHISICINYVISLFFGFLHEFGHKLTDVFFGLFADLQVLEHRLLTQN